MKSNYCHVSFILDESGSMNSILNDTIGGFNTFLKSQQDTPGEATVSLTTFNYNVHTKSCFIPIQEMEPLNNFSYKPGGGTALYDAIGKSISECGEKLSGMEECDRPEKVIIVILTDGEENLSKKYNHREIQEMIKTQTNEYSWEFVFLGANLDAEKLGSSLGIKSGNSMTFMATEKGVGASFGSMATNISTYRLSSLAETRSTKYTFFKQSDKDAQRR